MVEAAQARQGNQTGIRRWPGLDRASIGRVFAQRVVALDLFTEPSATFRVLYCFFVIEHERRRILHFNVTRHPSADWVVQPAIRAKTNESTDLT
jgi:hypothetical protein